MDETAGEIAQKLRRGNAMYKYADGDADGLGLALLAFHGALADWLDEQLMRDEALDHATREAASTGKLGWLPRADAALRRGLISADQRRLDLLEDVLNGTVDALAVKGIRILIAQLECFARPF